jgi:hypothetical protein
MWKEQKKEMVGKGFYKRLSGDRRESKVVGLSVT